MKYEWRKIDKDIYLPKKIQIIALKPMKYITISGTGNPGSKDFSNRIAALYGLAYPIKMKLKKIQNDTKYTDYTVFPMEGIWDFNDEGRNLYQEGYKVVDLKDYLNYKIMIRQPEYLTDEFFNEIKEEVCKKGKLLVQEVKLEVIDEGLVCQYLHTGSYDDEPASFEMMEEFCKQEGYSRISKQHKEIYISDARRVPEDKLKTTLRFQVVKD